VEPSSRTLVDAALAALAFAATLLLVTSGLPIAPSLQPVDALSVLVAAAATLPVAIGRRAPLPTFAVTAVASTLLVALGHRPGIAIGPAIALYQLTAARPLGRTATATVLGLFAVWLLATALERDVVPASEMFHGGLALATGWFAGERTRLRRTRIEQLETRAWRAEHERRLAVAEERSRIARDLHDSAGHAINVIGVLAGAARLRDDHAKSKQALAAIEEIARDTVGQLDEILHVLREDAATTPPGLASLETLVAQHVSSGLAITLQRTPPRPLAGTVDQAAFRILQEALTNAARHGTGSATVEVRFGAAGVALEVVNPVGAAVERRGGHGLIGMRERAALAGGTLEAGREHDHFRVHAELPYGR
jgi:signal transduction histidine kinase